MAKKNEPRFPWQKQEWETDGAFRAFSRFYLVQEPPRSVSAAYREYRRDKLARQGKSPDQIRQSVAGKAASGTWRRWSMAQNTNYDRLPGSLTWQERAALYDDYQAALIREKLEARRHKARLKAAEIGEQLREKAREALDIIRSEDLNGHAIAQLAKVGVELERLAYGESTENVQHTGMVVGVGSERFAGLEDEELDEEIERLLRVDERFRRLAPGSTSRDAGRPGGEAEG